MTRPEILRCRWLETQVLTFWSVTLNGIFRSQCSTCKRRSLGLLLDNRSWTSCFNSRLPQLNCLEPSIADFVWPSSPFFPSKYSILFFILHFQYNFCCCVTQKRQSPRRWRFVDSFVVFSTFSIKLFHYSVSKGSVLSFRTSLLLNFFPFWPVFRTTILFEDWSVLCGACIPEFQSQVGSCTSSSTWSHIFQNKRKNRQYQKQFQNFINTFASCGELQ